MYTPVTSCEVTGTIQVNLIKVNDMSIVIGGTELRVLYNPNLSADAVAEVHANVEASLWSGDSAQYCLGSIEVLVANGNLEIPTADAVVLGAIMQAGYDYIEIDVDFA